VTGKNGGGFDRQKHEFAMLGQKLNEKKLDLDEAEKEYQREAQ
jgi:hypothetical protein